jgi:hypothetical protein
MRAAAAVLIASLLAGCGTVLRSPTHPELATVAAEGNALALSDALEALIVAGRDTPRDRDFAFRKVRDMEAVTAGDNFAHAAIIGRKVQEQGLRAAFLLPDMEHYARRSRELDPTFRDGAATRLLGTLYVIAPARLLKHGDSETGLEMLEALTEAHPDDLENHLRLAEAYITLHDPDPAAPHLCLCLANESALRADERRLLSALVEDAGPLTCAPAQVARPTAAPRGRKK